MDVKRRKFLKLLGYSAPLGLGGLTVWAGSQSGIMTPPPEGKEQPLIIDPNGKKYVYRDGYIVEVDDK